MSILNATAEKNTCISICHPAVRSIRPECSPLAFVTFDLIRGGTAAQDKQTWPGGQDLVPRGHRRLKLKSKPVCKKESLAFFPYGKISFV